MMKKVSIVTPVYKVEKYIGDCIQSVINQTYPSIEFVLVDDCELLELVFEDVLEEELDDLLV